jgi:hypothetical protein
MLARLLNAFCKDKEAADNEYLAFVVMRLIHLSVDTSTCTHALDVDVKLSKLSYKITTLSALSFQ